MKWYALYVNVRHEKKVMQKLLDKGIEAYTPIIKTMRQWSDRKKLVEAPLFTGYVFVRINEADFDKPRFIAGVVNYLRFEGKPAVVRDEEIEGLKFFVQKGFSLEVFNSELTHGARVQLTLSQFKEFDAVVEEILDEEFAIISFEGIKKNIRLKAPKSALRILK